MKTRHIYFAFILAVLSLISCSSQKSQDGPGHFRVSVFPPHDLSTDLRNGYYIAQGDNGYFGVKSEAQDTMLSFRYEALEPLWDKDSVAFCLAAKYKGKWGVLDVMSEISGEQILDFKYEDIWIPEDHEVIVVGHDGRFGMYDFSGKELLPELYGAIYPYLGYEDKDGLGLDFLLVEDYDGRGGIADYDGNIIVPVVCTKIAYAEGYWFTLQYDDNTYAAYLLDGRPVRDDEVDGRHLLAE